MKFDSLMESLRRSVHGYDACAGYHVLRSRASVDAQLEMQTFLCITSQETESEIAQILRIFKENH